MSDTQNETAKVRVPRAKISITQHERDLMVKGLDLLPAEFSADAYRLIKRLKAL